MKDKNSAALLALFAGVFGVHRFYLRQPGLGVLYIFLMFFMGFSALLGFIDFIVLLSMSNEEFDRKYNRDYLQYDDRRTQTDFHRRRSTRREREGYQAEVIRKYPGKNRTKAPSASRVTSNPHKQNGIRRYRSYDYEGAIEDFKKALSVVPDDMATHFNIACAYSLLEEKEKAFFHLSKAVQYGFDNFDKINTHDALAFLRIQDEFDNFVDNGYQLGGNVSPLPPLTKEAPKLELQNDLLNQLRQLGELKEKGLLTEEEFQVQKQKLLNRD